jgi:beta-aspartyl-peptidase (threonine type)
VPLQQAADEVVLKELVAQRGDGGVIALDRKGNVASPFNTPGMLFGVARQGSPIRVQGWSREGRVLEVPQAP